MNPLNPNNNNAIVGSNRINFTTDIPKTDHRYQLVLNVLNEVVNQKPIKAQLLAEKITELNGDRVLLGIALEIICKNTTEELFTSGIFMTLLKNQLSSILVKIVEKLDVAQKQKLFDTLKNSISESLIFVICSQHTLDKIFGFNVLDHYLNAPLTKNDLHFFTYTPLELKEKIEQDFQLQFSFTLALINHDAQDKLFNKVFETPNLQVDEVNSLIKFLANQHKMASKNLESLNLGNRDSVAKRDLDHMEMLCLQTIEFALKKMSLKNEDMQSVYKTLWESLPVTVEKYINDPNTALDKETLSELNKAK